MTHAQKCRFCEQTGQRPLPRTSVRLLHPLCYTLLNLRLTRSLFFQVHAISLRPTCRSTTLTSSQIILNFLGMRCCLACCELTYLRCQILQVKYPHSPYFLSLLFEGETVPCRPLCGGHGTDQRRKVEHGRNEGKERKG